MFVLEMQDCDRVFKPGTCNQSRSRYHSTCPAYDRSSIRRSPQPPTLPSTTMTSNYTAAPPPYQGSSSTKPSLDGSSTPLLGGERVAGSSSGPGAIYDQPDFDDIPDDFKACFLCILTHFHIAYAQI